MLQGDAAFFQRLDDRGPFLDVRPVLAQFCGRSPETTHLSRRVIGELHHPKLLAGSVQLIDHMRGNFHVAAVHVVLA
jgi:hypothetical protein